MQGEKKYIWKVNTEWGSVMGDKGGVSASIARVVQLLHKLEQSCLLLITFKELPFGSNKQRMFLAMSLWRNILKAD